MYASTRGSSSSRTTPVIAGPLPSRSVNVSVAPTRHSSVVMSCGNHRFSSSGSVSAAPHDRRRVGEVPLEAKDRPRPTSLQGGIVHRFLLVSRCSSSRSRDSVHMLRYGASHASSSASGSGRMRYIRRCASGRTATRPASFRTTQMLRDGGLGHPHLGDELADGALAVPQEVEDPPPAGFCEHFGSRLSRAQLEVCLNSYMPVKTWTELQRGSGAGESAGVDGDVCRPARRDQLLAVMALGGDEQLAAFATRAAPASRAVR